MDKVKPISHGTIRNIWIHKSSLTTPLYFIEVPVPNHVFVFVS